MLKDYLKNHQANADPLTYNFRKIVNLKLLRVMKLTIVFFTIFCLQLNAAVFSQKVTINQKNMPLEKVIKEIKRQTGYFFLYDLDLLQQKSKPVDISVKEADIKEVLTLALKAQPFDFEIKANTILIKPLLLTDVTNIDVKGTVVDENGLPMAGASVRVKGSSVAVIADNQGNFLLKNIDEQAILVISYIGYEEREVKAKTQLGNIKLNPQTNTLANVVVTGYTNYTRSQSATAVSTVSADKINQVPGLTVDQILQGRVPGMSVISTSGQPGQSAAVVIRGIGSVNGSSTPLYVLDGVPIEGNYFQTINPEDIESASVLKDASAKALYGSRGSNGVIILTTKKGKSGALSINYNSQYGFSNLSRPNFEMMNTSQRLQFEEEIGLNYGRNLGPGWTYSSKNPNYISGTPTFRANADRILDSLRHINVDWRDMFFQTGKFQEQQVSISGGNERIRFYNSLNYYKQDGVAKRTGMDRYALRSNVDFNDNKFSGNVNLSLGYSQSSFTEGEGGTGAGTAMASVYYALPYEYPYAPDGTLIHPGNQSKYFILDQREGSQGLERLYNSSDKTDQLKTIISTSFAYQILPELKITTRAGIDYRNSADQTFINPDSYYGSRSNSNTLGGKGRLTDVSRRNFNIISTSGLVFNKTFNVKHDVELAGYYEYVYNNFSSFGFDAYGIDGRLPETPAGVTSSSTFLPAIKGSKTKSALASVIGIGRYTYDNRYTLNASYRYDGSTKVAPKNKWKGFYSFGASWNAKAENFMQKAEFISDLKLRASYGKTASPLSGDFSYLPTFVGTTYGGVAGIRPSAIGNPDYDWEYVYELNIGFDLSLLKSKRLRLSADYYNRKTINMFFDQPVSAVAGAGAGGSLPLSTGKMRNRGIEFEINGDVIKNSTFTWSVGVNAGYNKNKILYLTPLADLLLDGDTRVYKVGYPVGTYYAPDWAGVNPQTGEAQYYKLDGSITTVYDAATQNNTNSGSLYPTFTGGFNTSLSYKGFTASALFSFVSNVMRWNNEDFYNENQRYATSNQTVRMLNDRWKKPGDNAILQRFDIPRNFTSKDIQDASFLRLRNVNISYTVPQQLLNKTGSIKAVKIFVQGQNLYTWTKWRGLDPENNAIYGRFQYPNTRTYTAGLNVNF